jgi:hypothetical protein
MKERISKGQHKQEPDTKGNRVNQMIRVLQVSQLGQPESVRVDNNRVKYKKKDKMGIGNYKLRWLCTAAFLRCLHAAIDYAPNVELRGQAISKL